MCPAAGGDPDGGDPLGGFPLANDNGYDRAVPYWAWIPFFVLLVVAVLLGILVLLVLVRNGIIGDVLFGITLVYFRALVVICMMLFWQARVLARDKIAELRHSEPAYIRPATTAQLTEPTQSPASVTDNTTRTLDEMTIGQRQF